MDHFLSFLQRDIYPVEGFSFNILQLSVALLVIVAGYLSFRIASTYLKAKKNTGKLDAKRALALIRFVRIISVIVTLIFFFRALGIDTSKVLGFHLIKTEKVAFSVYHLLILYFIFTGTRLFLFVIETLFNERIKDNKVEQGKGKSIFQIIKYFIYVVAISLFLDSMGFSFTVILASLSALLVGLGLGIQHFFNDVISGIVILFDRSLKVGDIVEIKGETVGKVAEINLRTSSLVSRDDVVIIVPNSMFTSEMVINWSHNSLKTRFSVKVGVAYGSNVKLVKQLLIDAATEHDKIDGRPEPVVLFANFGDSSLDFELQFFTHESFRVERIKSDLRFAINEKFIENNITIPFPQRDVHISK